MIGCHYGSLIPSQQFNPGPDSMARLCEVQSTSGPILYGVCSEHRSGMLNYGEPRFEGFT
jgi:hypothetical protein